MTMREKFLCNGVIHAASVAAGAIGAGLAQIPCSDNALITPIQLTMTVSLGKIFGLHLDESAAKATVASAAACTVGRAASQVLVGWLPVVGNTVNAGTAAAVTETIGWILANEFAEKEV